MAANSSGGIPANTVGNQPFLLLGNLKRAANLAAEFDHCLARSGHDLWDSTEKFAADPQAHTGNSSRCKGNVMGSGGEGGIRTPGRGFSPYNGLANRRIQPLCHLSGDHFQLSTVFAFARYFWNALGASTRPEPNTKSL